MEDSKDLIDFLGKTIKKYPVMSIEEEKFHSKERIKHFIKWKKELFSTKEAINILIEEHLLRENITFFHERYGTLKCNDSFKEEINDVIGRVAQEVTENNYKNAIEILEETELSLKICNIVWDKIKIKSKEAMTEYDGMNFHRDFFIKSNIRLAIFLASKYTRNLDFEDVVQESLLGLIKAAEKFDHSKDVKFSSYATWWIAQKTSRIDANWRATNMPFQLIAIFTKIETMMKVMSRKLKRTCTIEDISKELNEDPIKMENLMVLKKAAVYSPLTISTSNRRGDMLGNIGTINEDSLGVYEYPRDQETHLHNDICKALEVLKPKEKKIVISMFGLFGETDLTLCEIAKELNLSRERVRQLYERSIKKLKETEILSEICS